jgi:hypothetical protein
MQKTNQTLPPAKTMSSVPDSLGETITIISSNNKGIQALLFLITTTTKVNLLSMEWRENCGRSLRGSWIVGKQLGHTALTQITTKTSLLLYLILLLLSLLLLLSGGIPYNNLP